MLKSGHARLVWLTLVISTERSLHASLTTGNSQATPTLHWPLGRHSETFLPPSDAPCTHTCSNQDRPVATGGRGGGAQPPLDKFEPPLGCAVPFAVTIGIEVYPPLEFCQPPPLLTIPGYGAVARLVWPGGGGEGTRLVWPGGGERGPGLYGPGKGERGPGLYMARGRGRGGQACMARGRGRGGQACMARGRGRGGQACMARGGGEGARLVWPGGEGARLVWPGGRGEGATRHTHILPGHLDIAQLL